MDFFKKTISIFLIIYCAFCLLAFIVMPVKTNILAWLCAATFFAIIYFCSKVKNIYLFILPALVLKLAIDYFINYAPTSDYLDFYNGANLLLQGSKDYLQIGLFKDNPSLIPYMSFLALILNVFKTTYAISVINILFDILQAVAVYKVALCFLNKQNSKFVFLFMLFNPLMLMYTPVYTNQHISAMLIYFAIYLAIKQKPILYLSGILLAVSQSFRGSASLFLLVLLVFLLFEKHNLKKKFISILLLLLGYFLSLFIIDLVLKLSQLSPFGLKEHYPLWKFVLGTNASSQGMFDFSLYNKVFIEDFSKSLQVQKSIILQNISNVSALPKLFLQKIFHLQINFQQFEFVLSKSQASNEFWLFYASFERSVHYILIIMVGVSSFITYKGKKNLYYLPVMMFLAYVFAHILMEVQARYVYEIIGFMAIIASYCLNKFNLNFTTKTNNVIL